MAVRSFSWITETLKYFLEDTSRSSENEDTQSWFYDDPQYHLYPADDLVKPDVKEAMNLESLKNISPFVFFFVAVLPIGIILLDRRRSIVGRLKRHLFQYSDLSRKDIPRVFECPKMESRRSDEEPLRTCNQQDVETSVNPVQSKIIEDGNRDDDEVYEYIFVENLGLESDYHTRGIFQKSPEGELLTIRTYEPYYKLSYDTEDQSEYISWDSDYAERAIYERTTDGKLVTIKSYQPQYRDMYQLELDTLRRLCYSPFFEKVLDHFEDERGCHIVTSHIPSGSLWYILEGRGPMSPKDARFYVAEIVAAVHLLDFEGFYLEPFTLCNVYLDQEGHVVLTHLENVRDIEPVIEYDLMKQSDKRQLRSNGFGTNVRYIGVILYELLTSENLLLKFCKNFNEIDNAHLATALKNLPKREAQFLRFIFQKDNECRNSAGKLYDHPYFEGIDWELVAAKKVNPPIRPH